MGVQFNPFTGQLDLTGSSGGGGGAVSSVNGFTGAVSLQTSDIPENINLYFTNGRAQLAVVTASITSGDTTHSPSGDAIFTALAGKLSSTFPIIAPESAAGAPSYAFGEVGNDTGMGSPSDGVIEFSTNAALAMTLDASQNLTVVGDIFAANFPEVGTANTIRAFDNAGVGTSLPSWTYQDVTGNTTHSYTSTPSSGTGVNGETKQMVVQPTGNSNGDGQVGIANTISFDPGNSGFDMNAGVIASYNRTEVHGSGVLDYASVLDNSMLFQGGGTTSLIKGNNLDTQVSTGTTVSNYLGVNSYFGSQGIHDGVNMFDSNAQIQNATLNNFNTFNSFANLVGTSTLAQTFQGSNVNLSIQDSASANNFYGSSTSLTQTGTSSTQNIQGLSSNIQMQDTSVNTNGITGINNGINIQNGSVSGQITGYSLNLQVRNTATATNVAGANFGISMSDTASVSSLTAINANPDIAGSSVIGNLNIASFGGNVHDSAAITNFTGMIIGPVLQGSATAVNFSALNINPQVTGSATVTNGVTIIQASLSTSTPIPNATGLSVNIDSANVADPFSKTAISSSGGSANIGYNFTIPSGTGFFQTHSIGGQENVAAGFPVSALGFGVNLAHTVNFQDDWTPDFTSLRLGFINTGMVGSIVGASGKTMDTWTGALAGAGNPSGSGTIDQAIMFRAAGILPQGGSVAVNNMYGFLVMPTIGAVSTNTWGFYDDSGSAENYLNRLAVGTTSKKVTSGIKFEVANGDAKIDGTIRDSSSVNSVLVTNRELRDFSDVTRISWGLSRIYDHFGGISFDGDARHLTSSPGFVVLDWDNFLAKDSSVVDAINWNSRQLLNSSAGLVLDWNNYLLNDSTAVSSLDWNNRELISSTGVIVANWDNFAFKDSTSTDSVNWNSRQLYNASAVTMLNWGNSDVEVGAVITQTQQTTPSNPAAGSDSLYFKADDKLYGLNSSGVEVLIGPSGGSTALTQDHIYVGNASNVATDVAMSGEASIVASGAVTLSNSAVIGKVLTGYTSGAGTVSAADSILSAIQKVDGNDALKLPLAGGTMSGVIAMGSNKITGVASGTATGDALQYGQRGAVNGLASLDGSGLVPITQIPPAALERLVIVANQTARFALTTATVQNGDTVKQTDTNVMYFVIDDTNLGNSSGYSIYTAGTASSVAWTGITGIPAPVSALLGTNTGDQTITLTGDVTGSGTGSFAATLATVNGNVGSFGDASHSLNVTANAKGLITAISTNSIQIAESQVTNLVTDLAAKEVLVNKATNFNTINNTLYPTIQAVNNAIVSAISASQSYVFAAPASDIATYHQAPSLNNFTATTVTLATQTVSTSPTLMATFATNSGYPNLTTLPAGVVTFTYDTQKATGANTYFNYAELYKRAVGGTETLLLTSEVSSSFPDNTIINNIVTGILTSPTTILTTDRLVVKVYCQMVSGTSRSIDLRYDDTTNARLDLPLAALGYVPENVTNKSTDGTFAANSDTLYPSQKAAKTYADTKLATSAFTDTAVTSKLITGYVSSSGTVAATDTILQAIQKLNGNTSAISAAAVTSLTGEATGSGPGATAVTLSNAAVIAKVLTGYASGAGTISAADSILSAIQKLNGNSGNFATKALDNLASVAINASLLPATDDTIDVGSSAKQFSNVFVKTKIESNAAAGAAGTGFFVQTKNVTGAVNSANVNLTSGTVDTSAQTTGILTAHSGDASVAGTNTGVGSFRSGDISATSGAGASGNWIARSGNIAAGTNSGNSGAVSLISGTQGAGNSGNTGGLTLSSGANSGTGNSGGLTISSGTTTSATSGNISITTGASSAGTSGSISITAGSGSVTRGNITLNAVNVILNNAAVGGVTQLNAGATGTITANSKIIGSVADPVSAQDAMTLNYSNTNYLAKLVGDLNETTFSGLVNNTANQTITGFAFANASVRSFDAVVSVLITATANSYAQFKVNAVQRGSDWAITSSSVGDSITGFSFSITAAGQVQASIGNITGFASATMKFRALTTSV